MRYVALKIDSNGGNYVTVVLGCIIILCGLLALVTGYWYLILFSSLVGGCYVIWSGYLGITMRKKASSAVMTDTIEVGCTSDGKVLFIQYDPDAKMSKRMDTTDTD